MNRLMVRILSAALLMGAFVMTQAVAQTSSAPASKPFPAAKIAWINLDQVLLTCDEGVKQFDEIQEFVNKKSDEMDAMRKELETLKKELELQAPKLKEEAYLEKKRKIDNKEVDLQRFQQDTQSEINYRRDKATNVLGDKLVPVIIKIAKEKGINVVQTFSSTRDVWIDETLIITDEVIKAFNQANPVLSSKPSKNP
jgi:Skp family chaperone for outer membrane proteins